MKVVVGSSDLELSPDIINAIVGIFSTSSPEEAFAIRTPHGTEEPRSPVEIVVQVMAARFGRAVTCFSPLRQGRAATFYRDYDLVEYASEVLAFFSPEREMAGGTGHVVKAALDRGVKVDAYSVRPDGTLVYLGSEEGDPDRRYKPNTNDVLNQMWKEAQ